MYSLNHTTKRVNFGLAKIHQNSTAEENHSVLRVPHGSAHTPGVSGLCTPAAHSGPSYLWISGAICRAPSTWEATTRKPVSLTEVKHTCLPSALGFTALPRNRAPKHADHWGPRTHQHPPWAPTASSTVPTLGKAHERLATTEAQAFHRTWNISFRGAASPRKPGLQFCLGLVHSCTT